MTEYGRYFEFRNAPTPENRYGRAQSPAAVIPIGAPVAMTTTVIAGTDRNLFDLAAEGAPAVKPSFPQCGIAVFEHAYETVGRYDPALVGPSDFPDIPAGSAIQVVHGTNIKFVLRNIATDTVFFNNRTYDDARTMVAPTDLSTLAVGDFLVPGAGANTTGFWKEGGTAGTAWAVVTHVDAARGEIEAQLLF